MKELKFDVKITGKDMACFMLNNSYRKVFGVVSVIFSAVVIAIAVYTWGDVMWYNSALLLLLASLYIIINPLMLVFKAYRQVKKTPCFADTLYYEFNDEGITVSQKEEKSTIEWDNLWKAVHYGSVTVIYVSTVNAFVLPDRCIGDKYNELVECLSEKMGAACRLRKKSA